MGCRDIGKRLFDVCFACVGFSVGVSAWAFL